MPVESALQKNYGKFYGLDVKSNALALPHEFALAVRNAQISSAGSLEKRLGFQGAASSVAKGGIFEYSKLDGTTEIIGVGDHLYKIVESTITLENQDATPTAEWVVSIFFDTVSDQYRCQLWRNGVSQLDEALGLGVDEATPVTLDDLAAAINALSGITATVAGDGDAPAAFLEIVREQEIAHFLSTAETFSFTSRSWTAINHTLPALTDSFSFTGDNAADWELASFVQMNGVVYIGGPMVTGIKKYDGQALYRAGLPSAEQASISAVDGGFAGNLNGSYLWMIRYTHYDAMGNVISGNEQIMDELAPLALANRNALLTVPNIIAGSGYMTDCAIVNGAQVNVNTITVDAGHTMKVGDTATLGDANTPDGDEEYNDSFIRREVTAITATTITIDGAPVTVADNNVISNNLLIEVWRNKTGSLADFYLVGYAINDSFSASQVYADNDGDADLGELFASPLADRSVPPSVRYLTRFQNHLVAGFGASGDDPRRTVVKWSDVDGPEYWPEDDNEQDMDDGDGSYVKGLAGDSDDLIVFKNRGISSISGTLGDSNYRVRIISADLGCLAHHTIKRILGSIVFLSERGPYRITGGQSPVALGQNSDKSSRLEPVFARNQFKAASERLRLGGCLAVNDIKNKLYILFCPIAAGDTDIYASSASRTFVYDYDRDVWFEWSGLNMDAGACFTTEGELFHVERRLNTTRRYTLYRRHSLDDAWSYQDNAEAISWAWTTGWETGGDAGVQKRFIKSRFFCHETTPNNSDATLRVRTELNFVAGATISDETLDLPEAGYTHEPSVESNFLRGYRARSMRMVLSNDQEQKNVRIAGWELLMRGPFKKGLKPL